MKKLAALLMVLSLAMFNVGCEPAEEEPVAPADGGAVGADMDGDDTTEDGTATTTE